MRGKERENKRERDYDGKIERNGGKWSMRWDF